jgi:uncharacterized protein YwgA
MEARLTALKAFLDELGISATIDTIDDRKRVQKAVYLGQLSGVDLGYRYGWYLKGPYSPELTRDYYGLAEEMATAEPTGSGVRLREPLRQRLATVRPLLQPPAEVNLATEDWLELLASADYLRRVSKYPPDKMAETIRIQKPHLHKYTNIAEQVLTQANLI